MKCRSVSAYKIHTVHGGTKTWSKYGPCPIRCRSAAARGRGRGVLAALRTGADARAARFLRVTITIKIVRLPCRVGDDTHEY